MQNQVWLRVWDRPKGCKTILILVAAALIATGMSSYFELDAHADTRLHAASLEPAQGSTMTSALPVEVERKYRGSLSAPTYETWYKFNVGELPLATLDVGASTAACPIRGAVFTTQGSRLGEIIATNGAVLPFVLQLPSANQAYFLRIDRDPYQSCKIASYVFTQIEKSQGGPCDDGATGPEILCGPPPFVTQTCLKAGRALARATLAVARSRGRVRWRTLRKLEAKVRADRVSTKLDCGM
jgi:hypothetical protein